MQKFDMVQTIFFKCEYSPSPPQDFSVEVNKLLLYSKYKGIFEFDVIDF